MAVLHHGIFTTFNANGKLDPSPIINAVFRNGRAPSKAGRTPLSVEEGLVRLFANRAGWLRAKARQIWPFRPNFRHLLKIKWDTPDDLEKCR